MALIFRIIYQSGYPGGYSPEILVGVCGPPLETLTLFQTKICDFPYPISDLTHNFIPYFRPDLNLFRWVKHFRTSLNFRQQSNLISQRKKINRTVAPSKSCTQFQIRAHIPYPISDQNGQNPYPISDQTAQKPYPLEPHIPVWLI